MPRTATLLLSSALLTTLGVSTLHAQASIAAETKRTYMGVKDHILAAAAKMPDDGFAFKPTPDIRSFAEVVNHITEAQNHTCPAVIGGQTEMPKTEEGMMKKEAVLTALKNSFSLCDRAYDSMTDANAGSTIKTPRGERTRLGALVGNIAHDQEQWGIMSVYLRLKNIHPTGSE
ncbi:MAG: DinB family protein [Rhodospirillales bacterium]|nr:DinB family protein [Acetobacter sp.]